jgi:hypothetical protein
MNIYQAPHKLGKYRSKTYSRYTVYLQQSGLDWSDQAAVQIVASSPVEACNTVRDEFTTQIHYPTEFICAGPKGGIVSRFAGWETIIGSKLFALDINQQVLL